MNFNPLYLVSVVNMEMEQELERYIERHKRYKVADNRPAYQEGKRKTRVEVCFSVPTVFRRASLWPIMSNDHNLACVEGTFYCLQVYTVNWESKYIMVRNVHALGVTQELLELFPFYGEIEE